MLLLHVFLAWHSCPGIRIGLPDFSSLYTAGVILHEGQAMNCTTTEFKKLSNDLFPQSACKGEVTFFPSIILPLKLYLFIPLARLPYVGAYLVWFGINLAF